jgi:Holliday junction resolvase-like predicted endonuclease
VLERNLRLAGGELDLVTLDRKTKTLCVVEVKARLVDRALQAPEAQFGPAKQRQVARLTRTLLARPAVQRARRWFRGVRIDLVAVDLDRRTGLLALVLGPYRTVGLRHYPGAVGDA